MTTRSAAAEVPPDAPPVAADRVHTPKRITAAHRAEYVALRGMSGALRALGVRGASGVGGRIGGLGFSPFRIRRTVAEDQISKAFPELSAGDVSDIARASFEHLGRTTMETMLLPS